MQKTFIILILSISIHADISDIGKNFNKAIEIQGKLLDKANEMLDSKTPLLQLPKIQYIRKPQDIMCESNLRTTRFNNDNLNKKLKRNDQRIKKLQEENIKFKKLLEIHGIDYAHADIKVELQKKNKKMEMTITNK
jgi:hypothetical protein